MSSSDRKKNHFLRRKCRRTKRKERNRNKKVSELGGMQEGRKVNKGEEREIER
jgi:hypothetical protein